MPLVNMKEMLSKAREEKYAVGNFDVYNYEMLSGVMEAATKQSSPIIIAYAEGFKSLMNIKDFVGLVREMASRADVPVALHLDHANNMDIVREALDAGFTSVMMDASDQSLEKNIELSAKVVELCKKYGASTEAELGHVGGLEGQYEASDYETNEDTYTKVEEAVTFVELTKIDTLAVAIGTVHGVLRTKPNLNLQRLHELHDAVDVPLALHGGSGLSDAELKNCVAGGICKVNIFTDLTIAAIEQMQEDADSKLAYLDRCVRVKEAVAKVATDRMQVLGSVSHA